MLALADVAYHDYEGVALNHDERERIVADLGTKNSMILRNHGTLTCGGSAAQTYSRMFFLERACKMQIMAQSGGGELILCGDDVQEVVTGQSNPKGMAVLSDKLVWPAVLGVWIATFPATMPDAQILLSFGSGLSFSGSASAGAWVQTKGDAYLRASLAYEDHGTLEATRWDAYTEWGLSDVWTLTGKIEQVDFNVQMSLTVLAIARHAQTKALDAGRMGIERRTWPAGRRGNRWLSGM